MLKALELAGFKSFADRTRFEFPDGITVVVGPNGSGKSNVVDAIKWVLGAQSAKALRGKDMIDVIFKGSHSDGRKPCNSAEATLVFDNSQQQLSVDAEEVHVTRRVYRSGEGEYQINGQACRLKDIRNLFRGTGVGVDAYSLIEQGKVDRMLQASPRDRRLIFEEAAGISRFNAKKVEANRRLDRVEQNLLRLKDIVDEVHTRLNRLKSQASKAQRFREMSSRLREVRCLLGWTEYSQLASKTDRLETKLKQLDQEQELKATELQSAQQAAREAELSLHRVAEQCQDVESQLQEHLQQIAVCQNQQAALQARITESHEEESRQSVRLATLRYRAASIGQELGKIESAVAVAQAEVEQARAAASQASQQANALRTELTERNQRYDILRGQHVAWSRDASSQESQIAGLRNRLQEIQAAIQTTEQDAARNERAEHSAREALGHLADAVDATRARAKQCQQQVAQARLRQEQLQQEVLTTQERSALIQGRLTGAGERLEMLEQLQQHQDGVDAGVRHVLDLAQNSTAPVFRSIQGLLAELLNVDVQLAPLIDTALGPAANILVLEDGQLLRQIQNGQIEIPGRLSMMRLDRVPARRFSEKIQLDGVQGVIGRADRLVRCKNKFIPLVRYLLGSTWLVESLEIALELGHFRGAGLRFLTSQGELIEADGCVTMGANQSSSGLVSRRSEIHETRTQLADLQDQHQRLRAQLDAAQASMKELRPQLVDYTEQAEHTSAELVRQQTELQEARQQLESLHHQASELASRLADLLAQRSELEPQLQIKADGLGTLQSKIVEAEQELAEHEQRIRGRDQVLMAASQQETATQVDLARAEQRLESIQATLVQSSRGQAERQQAAQDAQAELRRLRHKRAHNELEELQLSSQLAQAYLRSEIEERQLEELARSAHQLRAERTATAKQLESARRAIERLDQQREHSRLEFERCQETRQLLLKRYAEDYEIDFAELSATESVASADEVNRLDAEATQLRQDISSVGEINMAALAELDELQSRYDLLNGQYEDLVAAKESLQRIIQKINNDSRRMFTETLEIIRQNFQKLYRKSFGGGHADIVLEEGADVLEGGIDIIATPPGKTALSNSLLSGGEKALTAVALLLAIFQYRPSPFCVLDEVDAPFDEANIGRFVNVLNEFLDWTKFVIVTHSKKTMTAATTLYGVTMQESGVSKQVAVRFEDVNDKGEIIDPDNRQAA